MWLQPKRFKLIFLGLHNNNNIMWNTHQNLISLNISQWMDLCVAALWRQHRLYVNQLIKIEYIFIYIYTVYIQFIECTISSAHSSPVTFYSDAYSSDDVILWLRYSGYVVYIERTFRWYDVSCPIIFHICRSWWLVAMHPERELHCEKDQCLTDW